MFTGIIQDVGRITSLEHQKNQSLFVFATKLNMSVWQLGDSVAVDGCCLTITDFSDAKQSLWSATLSPETIKLTRFSQLNVGDPVNLEPALRMGDALGGHMVSGHIDDVAKVVSIVDVGEHQQITFEVPEHLKQYVVVKGSVTLNGVSLTVNTVEDTCFTVNLIPHTLEHTNLHRLQKGDRVNLETDLLGRYVERILSCNTLENR
ncbi:MAG: riboflavin synthase [Zetaproteobacteria bacterium]|nr:MAG: riboflavin synthase [Zetaproteobacteria bacterium]